MKGGMLPPFHEIFDYYKPKSICEIGTHRGKSANQFVRYCCKYVPDLYYEGYDAFELVQDDKVFAKKEGNGKKHGSMYSTRKYLDHQQKQYKNFKYKLIKGFTQDTLKEKTFDFVYIDGGHSYETVMHDYNKLKNSTVIVFDDYNLVPVKKAVDEIFENLNYPMIDWSQAFTAKRPCVSILPVVGKHIQPVIFNA